MYRLKKISGIDDVKDLLKPYQERLLCHEIYNNLGSIDYLRFFLEHHAFVLWNFMSLIKVLQNHLTCLEVPWTPTEQPNLRRSINQLILEEESGMAIHGRSLSHLEFFMLGMAKVGAKTDQIELLHQLIKEGKSVEECFEQICISSSLKNYILYSYNIIRSKELHKIAGIFAFSNIHLLPDFFHEIYENPGFSRENISTLQFYFRRKQELEKNDYKIKSYQLVNDLCGKDENKWAEVCKVAAVSLKHRIILWDNILDLCTKKRIFSYKG